MRATKERVQDFVILGKKMSRYAPFTPSTVVVIFVYRAETQQIHIFEIYIKISIFPSGTSDWIDPGEMKCPWALKTTIGALRLRAMVFGFVIPTVISSQLPIWLAPHTGLLLYE